MLQNTEILKQEKTRNFSKTLTKREPIEMHSVKSRKTDIKGIVHLADIDGTFVPEDCVK